MIIVGRGLLVLVWFFCMSFGVSQGVANDSNSDIVAENQPYEIITEYQKIIEIIDTTEEEILLRVDTLRNQELAEALRRAMTLRGVEVYMMIPTDGLEDKGSYFVSLASIGAKTKIAEGQGAFLVSDRESTVFGSMLEKPIVSQGDMLTMLVVTPDYARIMAGHFIDAYSQLETWDWQSVIRQGN